jgi:hypothetical protein
METAPLDLTELNADYAVATASTTAQRAALYRLGKSRSWVKRFAARRDDAARAIDAGLKERAAIEDRKKRMAAL